ncbi:MULTISPECIES: PEP-CTERM sorting domain-containing protein [unclassified Moorena]|uniref:PEP-CTERM sorting domain-containing protein n=1 Tax=unclassified Moorena TaxID=2683338 RepID=UPI0013C8FB09|nr:MULTISPECIES: PEP-CTERM sorting domain-containing protein [unclassified Moorena]NEO21901.1 PEP-CTERM sorting domain-containing protein [Moorena sp. SIO4A5]NEP26144.1 PEP-CTERM sorting domain-containing protein [Moorena sp. SIO3I6]NEQ61817.1 PEP-CTERM sorting domain-containing protein [Moorena sp. SIO4A1]
MKKLSTLTLTAALVTLVTVGANPALADTYLLDFEKDDAGNLLQAGTKTNIGEQWAKFGVHITSNKGSNHPLRLFNSNCGPDFGITCSGGDADLATGPSFGTKPQGNVLIINENTNEEPDDWAGGGIISFAFDKPVSLDYVTLIDIDENLNNTNGYLEAFLKDGTTEKQSLTLGTDNSLSTYDFSYLPEYSVTKLDIKLPGSGAVSGIKFRDFPDPPKPSKKVPEPTSTLGLLMLGAMGAGSVFKRYK